MSQQHRIVEATKLVGEIKRIVRGVRSDLDMVDTLLEELERVAKEE